MFTPLEEQQLRSILTRNIDMHKRRVINASDAVDPGDYITKRQVSGENSFITAAAHHLTHELGGTDEINVDGLSGRLADQQDPLPHASRHYGTGVDPINLLFLGGYPTSAVDDDFLFLSEGFFTNPLPQQLDTEATPLFKELHLENLLSIDSPITIVNGSTSGNAEFNQPLQGASYKLVLIYVNNLVGDATYTFPTPFTYTPESSIPTVSAFVSALSTTSVTVTGMVAGTGFIEIFGY